MRAWRSLRMTLHAEHRQLPVLQAFHGVIVEVDVCDPQVRRPLDRVTLPAPDREAVVLRRNLDRAIREPADRVVPRPVAVQQLVGLAAERAGDELVAEA